MAYFSKLITMWAITLVLCFLSMGSVAGSATFCFLHDDDIWYLQQPKPPVETLKKLVDATRKKDIDATKKLFSIGSLKLMEEAAKRLGTTLNETIFDDEMAVNSFLKIPQVRNQKITGTLATLEVKEDETNDWNTMYFTLEKGEWKIALDKALEAAARE